MFVFYYYRNQEFTDSKDEKATLQRLAQLITDFNSGNNDVPNFQASLDYIIPPTDNPYPYVDYYPSKEQEEHADILF